ncbi:hypothetical protein [Glycomyces salinus]|uniref:hypothetical protein n=1 Tax=Glycomyces salinus TaxID=980294 RepID=UPI001E471FA1
MRSAIGEEPAEGVKIEYAVSGDYDDAVALIDKYAIDLVLLDGEAQPAGGLGIARQLRDELDDPPAIAVVLARAADQWLAAWSRADAALTHPLNPVTTAETVVDLLVSRRSAALPSQRAA